jgi:hypothetical protein
MKSDIYRNRGKRPLTATNVVIHFVADGGSFDLIERKVLCL